MKIYIFGNKDLEFDSLPLRILPELKRRFPQIEFEIKDPNEELDIPEELIIIDTVSGIDSVKVFSDLKNFAAHPNVSLHDFDLYSNLRYLGKLGKLKEIKIIGVPPTISEKKIVEEITTILNNLATPGDA
mgnify:CR=1 FL=1